MKKKIASLAAIFAICLPLAAVLSAQTASQQDQQKAMEAYMKQAAVTENHALLKQYVGRWDASTTMWTFPGTPPTTSRNAYEVSLIMGGRFIMMHFKGTMMGEPFEGLQIMGYNNLQKKYITFWIDSTSTAFYLTTGTTDAARRTLTETGDWQDPMTGGMTKVRAVTTWRTPDEFVYEMYMVGADDKEFKSMENRCIRVK